MTLAYPWRYGAFLMNFSAAALSRVLVTQDSNTSPMIDCSPEEVSLGVIQPGPTRCRRLFRLACHPVPMGAIRNAAGQSDLGDSRGVEGLRVQDHQG